MNKVIVEIESGVAINVYDKSGKIQYSVLDWDIGDEVGLDGMLLHLGIPNNRLEYYRNLLEDTRNYKKVSNEAIQEVLND